MWYIVTSSLRRNGSNQKRQRETRCRVDGEDHEPSELGGLHRAEHEEETEENEDKQYACCSRGHRPFRPDRCSPVRHASALRKVSPALSAQPWSSGRSPTMRPRCGG